MPQIISQLEYDKLQAEILNEFLIWRGNKPGLVTLKERIEFAFATSPIPALSPILMNYIIVPDDESEGTSPAHSRTCA